MTWQVLVMGVGLWFLIEGAIYAGAPDAMQKMGAWLAQLPAQTIRQGGLWSVVVGLVLLYLVMRLG